MPYGTLNVDKIVNDNGVTFAGLYGFKNRIINGDMRIDQRNAGASVTVNSAGGVYTVDRWLGRTPNSAGVFTVQRSATAPSGFRNSLLCTVTTAASVGASDLYFLQQRIEGFNVADLGFGAAGASSVTVSFWVRSSLTGNFGASIGNNVDQSYPFSFTINAANTFEQKTVTIPGSTTGTWLTDNSTGLLISFSFGTGSSYTGTANTWANYPFAPTSSVNLIATNGATFYITGVQLERGSTATSFDYRPYGTELALCQRYYEAGGSYQLFSGYVENANIYYLPIRFSVTKRAAPSVTPTYVAASRFPASAPTASSVQVDGFYTQATSNLTGTGYYQFSWTASAEL